MRSDLENNIVNLRLDPENYTLDAKREAPGREADYLWSRFRSAIRRIRAATFYGGPDWSEDLANDIREAAEILEAHRRVIS